MIKRKKPIVIRFHKISKDKDPEGHYHRLLLLYLPWTDEKSILEERSYEKNFEKIKS